MLIDDILLDEIMKEATESPRLRMNRDMRNSVEDKSQRMLNAFEVGTVLPIHRHRTSSETQVLLRGRIDVMFYDDRVISSERLTLPHPLLHEREFALAPLCEIMPEEVHPVLHRSLKDLYETI